MSSLLGLKIVVLSCIYVLVMRIPLSAGQWTAVILSAAAAVWMNWSGGKRVTAGGLAWLAATLVFYSLTDIVLTHLMKMPTEDSMILNAFGISSACYVLLGILSLPFLYRYRPSMGQVRAVAPFTAVWYFSQLTLFVCFGAIGPVFGNVIQSARGVISVFLGMALMHFGMAKLDAKLSRSMWVRRILASVLMAAAIILYSLSRAR